MSKAPTTEPTQGTIATTPPANPEAAPPKKSLSAIAGEIFGANYKGTPPAAAAAESEPEGEPEAPVEGEKDIQSPDTDGEEVTPEGEPEGDNEAEGEGEPVRTLSELAEHYDLPPEWLETLTLPVKIDGKSSEVPLKDLIDGYQMREAAQNRLDEAKARAKALTQGVTAQAEALQAQFAVAAELIQEAEREIQRDASSPDLAQLRRDDPGEYGARLDELNARRESLEALKRGAGEKYAKTLADLKAKSAEATRARAQAEHTALLDKVPEWRDEKIARAEWTEMVEYAISQGFERQDVVDINDHRLVVALRKAMLFDRGRAVRDVNKKKFFRIPKTLRPGSPRPPEAAEQERLGKVKAEHKRTGTVDSAVALMRARRRQGGRKI